MAEKVLVTPRSLTEAPHHAVETMRQQGVEVIYCSPGRQPDEAELLSLVPEITGWVAGVEPISPAVIAAARHLRCISRNGTGVDNLPLQALQERNIVLRTANGANARGVAELAIAMMLSSLRNIPLTDRGIKDGAWPRKRGLEIRGRCLGVIGFGAVGREVARLGKVLGTRVLVHDPFCPDVAANDPDILWASLNECFASSDIISLHCPPPPGGKPLVDSALLSAARSGLILVNTARASLVDEVALGLAIDQGKVSGYCVDVFDTEPPQLPGLASRQEVIATSHIGGYTEESVSRATEFAIANLMDALRMGEHPF
jgi:D-3-phosphoglycerate dehydrogenase